MRIALAVAALLFGAACSGGDGAETFAADREAAEAIVAACEVGRRVRDCDAARRGRAEARRRDRETL